MRTLTLAIAVMSLVAAAPAQDVRASQPPSTITSRSELVLVPALVHEKSGAALTGLSKSDFRLMENGVRQKIAVFEEIKTRGVRPKHRSLPPGEFTNYPLEQPASKRVTIILMDAINTQFADRPYAHDQMVKFLEEMADSQEPIALLLLHRGGVSVIHDFTTDPSVLARALRRLPSGAKGPVVDVNDQGPDRQAVATETGQIQGFLQNMQDAADNYQATQRMLAATLTLDALQQIARAYGGIPGRKSLIWASGGFPYSIDDITRAQSGAKTGGAPGLSDVVPLYEKTWELLNSANIALYPVDVRGLVVLGANVAPHVTAPRLLWSYRRVAWTHEETLATFAQFADSTGGKAYYNTNDLTHAFHQAVDDSASYYLLGFYLTSGDRKPGWHKLKVKVNQPHAQVRARTGFYIGRADKNPAKSRQSDVALAMASPLDFTTLPLMARWTETTPGKRKNRVTFELVLPANAGRVDESEQNHLSIDFAAAARSASGEIVATNQKNFDAHLQPQSVAQVRSSGITYKGALDLAPGEYMVRFVVRDNLDGRMGSVAAPLIVH
jgi:VWFA-related protein